MVLSKIINWHKNNKGFLIVDHQRFENEIIPKYFRRMYIIIQINFNLYYSHSYFIDNQMSSVQRQLNLYGFRCVSRGEDKGCFYHADFQRGEWEKVKLIRRSIAQPTPYGIQNWKSFDFGLKSGNVAIKSNDSMTMQDLSTMQGYYTNYPEANNVLMKAFTNTNNLISLNIPYSSGWNWQQMMSQQHLSNDQMVTTCLPYSNGETASIVSSVTSNNETIPRAISNSKKHSSKDSFDEFLSLCDDLYNILDDSNVNNIAPSPDSLTF